MPEPSTKETTSAPPEDNVAPDSIEALPLPEISLEISPPEAAREVPEPVVVGEMKEPMEGEVTEPIVAVDAGVTEEVPCMSPPPASPCPEPPKNMEQEDAGPAQVAPPPPPPIPEGRKLGVTFRLCARVNAPHPQRIAPPGKESRQLLVGPNKGPGLDSVCSSGDITGEPQIVRITEPCHFLGKFRDPELSLVSKPPLTLGRDSDIVAELHD